MTKTNATTAATVAAAALIAGVSYSVLSPKSDLPPLPTGMVAEAVAVPPVVTNAPQVLIRYAFVNPSSNATGYRVYGRSIMGTGEWELLGESRSNVIPFRTLAPGSGQITVKAFNDYQGFSESGWATR